MNTEVIISIVAVVIILAIIAYFFHNKDKYTQINPQITSLQNQINSQITSLQAQISAEPINLNTQNRINFVNQQFDNLEKIDVINESMCDPPPFLSFPEFSACQEQQNKNTILLRQIQNKIFEGI